MNKEPKRIKFAETKDIERVYTGALYSTITGRLKRSQETIARGKARLKSNMPGLFK